MQYVDDVPKDMCGNYDKSTATEYIIVYYTITRQNTLNPRTARKHVNSSPMNSEADINANQISSTEFFNKI